MVLTDFFGVFSLDKSFQTVEVHLPEVAVLIEPGVYGAQGFGIELIDAVAAFAMLPHQVGTAQEAEVFRNGGARDGESSCDFSGGLAAPPQQIQDGAAGGIGKCLEGGFR